jgi:hypothetical protein
VNRHPNFWKALIPGAIFGLGVELLRRSCSIPNNGGRPLPTNAIIFCSHTDLYCHQIDLSNHALPIMLGDHSFLSYCWYPRQWWLGATVFRFERDLPESPMAQVETFLRQRPNINFWMASDSGGPYGKMRASLGYLALGTKRPLVAVRYEPTAYFTLREHKIPYPFSVIQRRYSAPFDFRLLEGKSKNEIQAIVQAIWEKT